MKTCSAVSALFVIALIVAAGAAALALDTTYYNVDTTPPLVTITDPGSDSFANSPSSALAVSGTVEDDASVTSITWITDLGAIGSCTGTTSWVAVGIPLAAGDNVITVVASDAAGNVGADSLVVHYEPSVYPPLVVEIQNPPSSDSYQSSSDIVNISGVASGGAGIESVSWATDKGYSGACDGTTSWTADQINLVEGDNVITVTATDAIGQTSSDVLLLGYTGSGDIGMPRVAITDPASGGRFATQARSVILQGTSADNEGIESVAWSNDRGGSGVCDGLDSWATGSIALAEGDNIITVTAADSTGYTASASLTVQYTAPPELNVAITTPSASSPYSTTSPSLNILGTVSGGYGQPIVTWSSDRGGSGVCEGSTSWQATAVPIAIGQSIITVAAEDMEGRRASSSLIVNRSDPAAPTVRITSPTTGSSYSSTSRTLNLSGRAAAEYGVDFVTWSNSCGGSGRCLGTTSWKVSAVPLLIGANVITVTATDVTGRAGSRSITVNCSDVAAPRVQIIGPTTRATYATTKASLDFSGSAADNFSVASVTWSNDRGGSGVCTGTKSWTVSGVELQPGKNTIAVMATDSSGLAATDRLVVTYTVPLPPRITILSPTADPAYEGSSPSIVIRGSASDDKGLSSITWCSDSGASGICRVSTSWTTPGISLTAGVNVISVTAKDTSGLTATDTITVTSAVLVESAAALNPTPPPLSAGWRQAQSLALAIMGPALLRSRRTE